MLFLFVSLQVNVPSRDSSFQQACKNRKDGCKFTYKPTPEGQRELEDHLRDGCTFTGLDVCRQCGVFVRAKDMQVRGVCGPKTVHRAKDGYNTVLKG